MHRPEPPPRDAATAWDHALPPDLLAAISKAFNPAATFWTAHNYSDGSRSPASPYFSFVVPLRPQKNGKNEKQKQHQTRHKDGEGGVNMEGSMLMEMIRHVQQVVSERFPHVANAAAAEWWCHSRPHSSGHQVWNGMALENTLPLKRCTHLFVGCSRGLTHTYCPLVGRCIARLNSCTSIPMTKAEVVFATQLSPR